MANENVGVIECPCCPTPSFIRKQKTRQKFYIFCPSCGLIQPTGETFQWYVETNGTFYEAQGSIYQGEKEPEVIRKRQSISQLSSVEKEAEAVQAEKEPEATPPEIKPAPAAEAEKKKSRFSGLVKTLLTE